MIITLHETHSIRIVRACSQLVAGAPGAFSRRKPVQSTEKPCWLMIVVILFGEFNLETLGCFFLDITTDDWLLVDD